MSQADINNVKQVADPTRAKETFGDIEDKANDLARANNFTGATDFFTQTLSGGILEVNEGGGVDGGPLIDQYDEFLGEITGRNSKREDLHRQEAALIGQQKERDRLLAEEANARRVDDVSASRAAGSRRRSSRSSRDGGGGSGGAFSLGDQRDFLGI